MEELAQLRQLLVAGNTIEEIALIDELEKMSKKTIIRNIESYLVLLLAHLIKHQWVEEQNPRKRLIKKESKIEHY